jgi:hypothetical protein
MTGQTDHAVPPPIDRSTSALEPETAPNNSLTSKRIQ